jgi:hypothetical protein
MQQSHLYRVEIDSPTVSGPFSCGSLRKPFCVKIDQKTHPKNQNQVPGSAMSFLARETVGFCLNAHAGPITRPGPE